MKNIILAAVMLGGFYSAHAQYIPEEEDWFFYDLSQMIYTGGPEAVESNFWSHGHSLSVLDDIVFGTSNFSFAYGLGFTSNNYHSNLNLSVDSAGVNSFKILGDTTDYRSNKINIQYLDIPIELRFRSKPNEDGKFFRWYVGGRFGVRFNSYSKFKSDDMNIRYYHPDVLHRIKLGVYTRIGYSFFNVYAYYGLLGVFDEGMITPSGESLTGIRPLSVGVSFAL